MIKIHKLILLLILHYLIALPRFNWQDLPKPLNQFVGEKPFDAFQYEKYVEFFRGNKIVANELEGPFSYRPLMPLIASAFPVKTSTSINLINLIFLTFGLFYILRLLRLFGSMKTRASLDHYFLFYLSQCFIMQHLDRSMVLY